MLHDAWARGLWYRTVQVMVEDKQGRVLLQKRSHHMELFPGRWEVSVAGHVDAGYDYDSAAQIEVTEELGLEDPKLEEIGSYQLQNEYPARHMNHFSRVYRLTSPLTDLKPAVHEVSELRWFSVAEVRRLIVTQPETVTDVLREIITRYY